MKRSRLLNLFFKNRSEFNRINYIQQRNYCVSLLRKIKKQYYANLNENNAADKKTFWKTIKPLLSGKIKSNEKITLVENDKILTQDIKVAEELNSFFSNVVKNLKILEYSEKNPLPEKIANPILKSVLKYDKHPSVTAIRKRNIRSHFEFSFVSVDKFLIEIKKLNPRKAAQSTDAPVKILKDNADIFADYICGFFNEPLNCYKFPSILKRPSVTPVFKIGYRCSKENYRAVSILPVMSKIFEMLLCKQLTVFADQNLSTYQYGFRKVSVHNIS